VPSAADDASKGRFRFRPALLASLRGYDRKRLVKDLTAGLIVGVVAIPLALAFAIASGVKPEAGLATAAVAGFLISALGGSRVQIGGPTGAFVVIVYGVVAKHGVDGLAIATVMAGLLLILFGILRLGRAIEFIPEPVIVGFTAGIGAIIFIGQLKEVLGLRGLALPAETLDKLLEIARHVPQSDPAALLLSVGTIATVLAIRKWAPRIPGHVVGLVAFTLLAVVLRLDVETISSRFGELPAGLSLPGLPEITLQRLRELSPAALTIALLGAIESLLSAVVADGMIEDRHDPSQELVGQGIANVVSPLFGGMPATGAIARTATNVQNGATSPIAGITHAVVVLVLVTFLAGTMGRIPLAVLGGILVVVAWYMSDVPRLLSIRHMPRADAAILVVTFGLTVVIDLVVAVSVGMVLASFLFMMRMSEVGRVEALDLAGGVPLDDTGVRQQPISGKDVPEGVMAYSVDGPFFFGAVERFERTISRVKGYPRVLIFRMRNVPYMDATGVSALESVVKVLRKRGTEVILSAVRPEPLRTMRRAGLVDLVGDANVVPDIDVALRRARKILSEAAAPPPDHSS
jgi:sulfate permease, SulP family